MKEGALRFMDSETWRAVPGYAAHYEVSSEGRVRSLDRFSRSGRRLRGRILRQRSDARGYRHVNLWLDGVMTTHRVHRLVLLTFVGDAPQGTEACHNDGIAANNAINNLRWDTHIENIRDKAPAAVRDRIRSVEAGICMRGHQMRMGASRYDCRPCRAERLASKREGRDFDTERADARAQKAY